MTKLLREAKLLFATSEFANPYLKQVKFVFADDKPNLNAQAIPYEEFPSLAASAINMPIKMRFLGRRSGAGNHAGSVPIGHISSVAEESDDGIHRLIAEGVLYADEYPDIIEYLEEAYAENDAPGISWELSYHDSVVEKGITLLKGVIARAATFVKYPAYGKRTALLALASSSAEMDTEMKKKIMALIEELIDLLEPADVEEDTLTEDTMGSKAEELLSQFIKEVAENPINKGGTNNVTLEEALAKIAELEAALASTKTELEAKASENSALAEDAAKVEELQSTIDDLKKTIADYQREQLVAVRTQKMVEAGIVLDTDEAKLAQKQELWAAMSEEVFDEVISTVAAVAKKAPAKSAEASAIIRLPKISPEGAGGSSSTPDLMSRMRELARGQDSAE